MKSTTEIIFVYVNKFTTFFEPGKISASAYYLASHRPPSQKTTLLFFTQEQPEHLGTEVDRALSFSDHSSNIYKRVQQRLFLLRKLRTFNVSKNVLTVVYKSLIESVLTYNISSWYTFLSVKDKSKLWKVIKHATKITGTTQTSLTDLHTHRQLNGRPTPSYTTPHIHSTVHFNSHLAAVTRYHQQEQTQ